MALSGQDLTDLSELLVDSLNVGDLKEFVSASTGDRLYDEYVNDKMPLRRTIRELLEELEKLGTTHLFLRYVYDRRPGKEELQAAIARLCPQALAAPDKSIAISMQTRGAAQADAPKVGIAPGLQRNVRPSLPMADLAVWLSRLTRIEHRVCRLEYNSSAVGTGFLVGPDTVLTNWHVYEAVKNAGTLNALGCRFGYVLSPENKLQFGDLVPVGADGLLNWSPYSEAETTDKPDDPPPTPEQLDYALLRLAKPLGEENVDGAKRGWITLPNSAIPLGEDAPLLIVQHPNGSPMKLALDTQAVIGRNANGSRIRYHTNTDGGSSGSPCFTMNLEIVALHHYGDPYWGKPKFNQGVPIERIRQRIEAGGFAQVLGV